jgi:preprotein translocase subunit YajC
VLVILYEILWWLQPPPAGAPGDGNGADGAPGQGCYMQLGMLALMVLVFYFLLIRPQQKREREREEMLKSLKKGAMVRTTGGIRGEITDLTDRDATLLISDKVKINVLRSHIAGAEGADEAKGDAKASKLGDKKG